MVEQIVSPRNRRAVPDEYQDLKNSYVIIVGLGIQKTNELIKNFV
jgi:hypothetical protein